MTPHGFRTGTGFRLLMGAPAPFPREVRGRKGAGPLFIMTVPGRSCARPASP